MKISSAHGGQLMSQPGGTTLVLHWAVDTEDNGEWNRPPKQMLPPGTNYRCSFPLSPARYRKYEIVSMSTRASMRGTVRPRARARQAELGISPSRSHASAPPKPRDPAQLPEDVGADPVHRRPGRSRGGASAPLPHPRHKITTIRWQHIF